MAGQQGLGVGYVIKKVVGFLTPEVPVCQMSGCKKPCYVENNGHVHDFCGKTHAREFKTMKDAERQQGIMREARLKAVQHSHNTGGHGTGWQGYPSYSMMAASGSGPSGPSCTRSGAPYGINVIRVS